MHGETVKFCLKFAPHRCCCFIKRRGVLESVNTSLTFI